MTSMASRRRSSPQVGTSTCVDAQARHRDRRGRRLRDRWPRSSRVRAQPQGPSCPRQPGQDSTPAANSFSTLLGSSATANTVGSIAFQSHRVSVAPSAEGRKGQLVLRSSPARRQRANRTGTPVLTLDDAAGRARVHPTRRSTTRRLGRGETLLREHQLAPSSIAVITTRSSLRDELLEAPITAARLVRRDARDVDTVVCENAHRLKGTEWQAVIVATLEPITTSWLPDVLYVAVSRAQTWLSVIAPDDTRELLGLDSGHVQ